MHSIDHGPFTMLFSSDLSGEVVFVKNGVRPGHPEKEMRVPGELIQAYIRKYVLAGFNDKFADLLHQQFTEFGGTDAKDHAFVLEGINNLKPISTAGEPTDVLHGETWLFGMRVHVTFLRVEHDEDKGWSAVDPAYDVELQHVYSIASTDDKPLSVLAVPGYEGKYIAYTYPSTE